MRNWVWGNAFPKVGQEIWTWKPAARRGRYVRSFTCYSITIKHTILYRQLHDFYCILYLEKLGDKQYGCRYSSHAMICLSAHVGIRNSP